jgi:hypothetical protein
MTTFVLTIDVLQGIHWPFKIIDQEGRMRQEIMTSNTKYNDKFKHEILA